MPNPWMKKNPYMSLWLSAAQRAAGTLRGHATAQARRQVKAAIAEAVKPVAPMAKSRQKH